MMGFAKRPHAYKLSVLPSAVSLLLPHVGEQAMENKHPFET